MTVIKQRQLHRLSRIVYQYCWAILSKTPTLFLQPNGLTIQLIGINLTNKKGPEGPFWLH